MNEPNCGFCAIVRGDQDADIVGSGAEWLALFPLNPATPGHTLIIPRDHIPDLWQADVATGSALTAAAILVGRALQSVVQPQGMNLITSAGTAAEQTVFHLHVHVVPRWDDDGFGRIWPPGNKHERNDLDDIAGAIREALRSGLAP